MAEYFSSGQPFARRTSYLVPEQLRIAATSMARRVQIYKSLDEILPMVEEIDPDVVLLFSGYLYLGDRLFSISPWLSEFTALEKLVKLLRDSGRVLATNDPFCGLTSRMTPWTFRFASSGLLSGSWRQRLVAPFRSVSTWLHCLRLRSLLKPLPHVYPGHAPPSKTRARNMAFFNQEACTGEGAYASAVLDDAGDKAPVWLFVISPSDLIIQRNLLGQAFAAIVSNRLTDTIAQGRTPILIAPGNFLGEVRTLLGPGVDAEMHESLPYPEFVATLANCEYAFYWNIFSFSTLLRIFLGRPTFFFDHGHLPRVVRGYYQQAVRCYLGGAEPRLIDPTDHLNSGLLESMSESFHTYSARIVKHLGASPSPARVVEELIAGDMPGS